MSADPRDPPSSTHRMAPALDSAEAISDSVQAAFADGRAALTLPGTIPGLLRRCSPVLAYETVATVIGTDTRPAEDRAGEWLCSPVDEWADVGIDDVRSCPAADLVLDLTDATGRAHAAWWLGGVGASLHLACDGHRRWELHGGERPRESALRAWEGIGPDARRLRGVPPEYGWDAEDVPALATLDPNDPRLLPDGSRWIDAEALRRVCLHVAGLEVTP